MINSKKKLFLLVKMKFLILCNHHQNSIFPLTTKFDTFCINNDPDHIFMSANSSFRIGNKWENILWYLTTFENWNNYDYIWFPDSTMSMLESEIEVFFEHVSNHNLLISQPSIFGKNIPHKQLEYNSKSQDVRKTNIVDSRMPCMKTSFVKYELLPFLNSNRDFLKSGWGIDLWWSHTQKHYIYVVNKIKVEYLSHKNEFDNKIGFNEMKYFKKKYILK